MNISFQQICNPLVKDYQRIANPLEREKRRNEPVSVEGPVGCLEGLKCLKSNCANEFFNFSFLI